MQLIISKKLINTNCRDKHKRSISIFTQKNKNKNYDFSLVFFFFVFWLHILDLFDCNGESSRSAFEEVPLDRLDANRLPTFALRTLAPVSPGTNSSSTSSWLKKKWKIKQRKIWKDFQVFGGQFKYKIAIGTENKKNTVKCSTCLFESHSDVSLSWT